MSGPIVYILGVSHAIQTGFYRDGAPVANLVLAEFSAAIDDAIDEYDIRGVFEELAPGNVASRSRGAAGDSIARRVVDTRQDGSQRIRYGMVDLTSDERANVFPHLGNHYPAPQGAREDAWIARIAQIDCWPALFICGAAHSLTFALAVLRYRSTDPRRWGCVLVEHEWEPTGDCVRFQPKG